MRQTLDDVKWDNRFLEMALVVSSWSKDPSTKVGAVIARSDRTIASLGYNGFPRGVADDAPRYADREGKVARTVHAETNALLNAHERVDGATLYSTFPPCSSCAGLIIQAGIVRVVCRNGRVPERWRGNMELAASMFGEAGVRYDYDVRYVDEAETGRFSSGPAPDALAAAREFHERNHWSQVPFVSCNSQPCRSFTARDRSLRAR